MWMVDCEDQHHVKDFKAISIGRKPRPLMPRPITAAAASPSAARTMNCVFSTLPSSCCCTSINPNIIAWSQPISCDQLSDYGIKREMINRVTPLVSPRWNPTPEQLQALEELYRRGLRTPSAQQIQHIAGKLRRFGKIEGKNVFYWFQNHKARERQKKRRLLELHASNNLLHAPHPLQPQLTGCNRENMELDHVKKQSSTFSNSSTPSQDSVSFHAAVVATEWTKLEQRELQQQAKNEQTCWQLDLSSCMSSNIINKNVVISEDIIINPHRENEKPSSSFNIGLLSSPEDDEIRKQTLPLFPMIKSHGPSTLLTTSVEEINDVSSIGMSFTPNEFYEFLPTKN